MKTPEIIRLMPQQWRGRPVSPRAFALMAAPGAAAWGVAEDDVLAAAMQTKPDTDGLAIPLLFVPDGPFGQDLADRLLHIAREQLRMERRGKLTAPNTPDTAAALERAGFHLEGGRWALSLPRPVPIRPQEVVIRPETPADHDAADHMVMRSFYNRYVPGCSEHLLTHRMRTDPDYVPSLSRVAEMDGVIAGGIWYAQARLAGHGETWPVLLFGPLSVAPEYQRRGLGAMLVSQTLPLAREAGWPGVVIMGDPAYYHRFGFRHAAQHGITLADGSCPQALMSIAFGTAALCKPGAVFVEPRVFQNLTDEDARAFDLRFPPMPRFWLPCQF